MFFFAEKHHQGVFIRRIVRKENRTKTFSKEANSNYDSITHVDSLAYSLLTFLRTYLLANLFT